MREDVIFDASGKDSQKQSFTAAEGHKPLMRGEKYNSHRRFDSHQGHIVLTAKLIRTRRPFKPKAGKALGVEALKI
ncbi:hypothetical protein M1D34_26890 (plasmid) [Ensifer sp. D2-11]